MTTSTTERRAPTAEPAVCAAADVMSAPVPTVSTRDTLRTAWGLIYRAGLRHLVVVDGARCVGVLDDRRIVLEWPLSPPGQHGTLVGDVIPRRVHAVLPDTEVRLIAQIMLDERTDAVPVVDEDATPSAWSPRATCSRCSRPAGTRRPVTVTPTRRRRR